MWRFRKSEEGENCSCLQACDTKSKTELQITLIFDFQHKILGVSAPPFQFDLFFFMGKVSILKIVYKGFELTTSISVIKNNNNLNIEKQRHP